MIQIDYALEVLKAERKCILRGTQRLEVFTNSKLCRYISDSIAILNFDARANSWLIYVVFKWMMIENINKVIKSRKAIQMQEASGTSRTHIKTRRNIGTDT